MLFRANQVLYCISKSGRVCLVVKLAGLVNSLPGVVIRGGIGDLPPDGVDSGSPPFRFLIFLEVPVSFEVRLVGHRRG